MEIEVSEQTWQPIETAPKDGTVFIGKNIDTGNEYETWYQKLKPLTETEGFMAELLLADDAGCWWANRKGEVSSFNFHVWRPNATVTGWPDTKLGDSTNDR